MRRAHKSEPSQQRTLPMTITPQVAPMTNQAPETPHFVMFLKHPNGTFVNKRYYWVLILFLQRTVRVVIQIRMPVSISSKDSLSNAFNYHVYLHGHSAVDVCRIVP